MDPRANKTFVPYTKQRKCDSQNETSARICLNRKSVFEKASLYGNNMQRIKCINNYEEDYFPVMIITNTSGHFRPIKGNMAYLQNAPMYRNSTSIVPPGN